MEECGPKILGRGPRVGELPTLERACMIPWFERSQDVLMIVVLSLFVRQDSSLQDSY